MRVVIAEDEEVARFRLEVLLSKRGYDVVAVKDGSEAWEVLQQRDGPTLAIIDWMMPGMSGLELCRRVRDPDSGPYVYVIMLTARGEKRDVVAGMDAGADDYLSKPFDMEELRVRLRAGERILSLQDALRVQATHDALTGLLNRGTIFEILTRQLAQAARQGSPVGVVLADLDHFKQINDTHGHPVGDAVLSAAANRMRSIVRPYDGLGRYGGGEFLVVLPGCGIETAGIVAERVRRSIADGEIETAQGTVALTASLGVASTEIASLGEVEALVRAADEALYRAKRGGRNRVECAA